MGSRRPGRLDVLLSASATNTGPMTRLSLIAVVAALALALPAAALAQSAGDNQYQDPLANQHHSSSGSNRRATEKTP